MSRGNIVYFLCCMMRMQRNGKMEMELNGKMELELTLKLRDASADKDADVEW